MATIIKAVNVTPKEALVSITQASARGVRMSGNGDKKPKR